ncbi:MAG TPA: MBL fold metallo-hydrolase [Candidatus Paceibacterota bacterium]|nr:MBL fold metallo-hydrolase [Candidatus Paceibacterota bacterium]HMP18836.1 MBL fold metallo-hydrolase [Candidatus Paceibacterota bacterium]HMP85372.1 MBL fold metallo-hydrolase [Candidatus Paceibacterota bacterium]
MIITYDNIQTVKINQGNITVAINPPSKKSNFSSTSFGSDIVLITTNHPDLNGVETATRNDQTPVVIDGPGEYEVKGFFIRGFPTKTNYGGKEKINTVYSLNVEGINILFTGAISDTNIPNEIKEEIGEVDIIFVPIGGDGVLEAEEAYDFAAKREPGIIIPIHYGQVGQKDSLKRFLKEAGEDGIKPVEKLVIKKKDLEGKESDIVILK